MGGGCDVQCWWWSGLGSESRFGPVGSYTLAPAPRKGPAGQDLAFQAGFALHSFSRLWVKDTRVNSPATLWMPRSRNCLKPRTCLVSPWTGSVMTLRRAYTSRPSGVCSLGPHGGAQRRPDLYLLTYPGLVVSLPTRGYVGIELSFGEHTQIAFAAISRICRE